MAKHHPDLVMCRKQPGVAIGRLCEKCKWRTKSEMFLVEGSFRSFSLHVLLPVNYSVSKTMNFVTFLNPFQATASVLFAIPL